MNLSDKLKITKRGTERIGSEDCDIYELTSERRNLFLESLDDLTADDIALPKPKKKRTAGDIITDLIRNVIIIICLGVFVKSAADILVNLNDYQRGDEIYGELADSIFNTDLSAIDHAVALSPASKPLGAMSDYYTGLTEEAPEIVEDTQGDYNIEFQRLKANLTYLKSLYPDIYGYIRVEGTNIDYPIVQCGNNEYYLDHDYKGNYMVHGAIFADYLAGSSMDDNYNTVFYGHNVKSGSMFNNVMNFLDESVFNSKQIVIYTFDGIYTYEPFAIFDTIDTYQYFRMRFADNNDFVSFCEEMQSKSRFNKNMTFTGDDRVITLSTCTNDWSGHGRYALHAKLVKVER